MLGIFITLLLFVLILITLFMMLVILMQRPNTNAGMGAAFGGGVTDSTFGAETANVLTRATKWTAVAYFVVALVLYLLYIAATREAPEESLSLPQLAPIEENVVPGIDEAVSPATPEDSAGAIGGDTLAPAADPVEESAPAGSEDPAPTTPAE